MHLILRRVVVVLACGSAVACTIGETHFETVTYPARAKSSAIKTCTPPFAKPKLDDLKSCMDGKGHCWAKSKLPTTQDLEECDGETVCVPNAIIEAGGKALKSCTQKVSPGAKGVCVDLAVPRLVEFKDFLDKDVCDEDQKCVPCVNPETNEPVPFCNDEVGVFENDCTGGEGGGKRAQSCCHGAGTCMVAGALPEDQRENLKQGSCPDSKVCAPTAQVSGKPVKCEILGGDGVCMDLCFAEQMQGIGRHMRTSCGPTEVCIPCVLGKGQGMRGCD